MTDAEWAAERKQYERDQYSTREQQKQWDEQVNAQQVWSAKPRAERVADAQYVLNWSPAIAKVVINGNLWMTEAIRVCQRIEEAALKLGLKSHAEIEEASRWLHAMKDEQS